MRIILILIVLNDLSADAQFGICQMSDQEIREIDLPFWKFWFKGTDADYADRLNIANRNCGPRPKTRGLILNGLASAVGGAMAGGR